MTPGLVEDTIVAIATPPGEGGVGMVRLSGPLALALARAVFRRRGEPLTTAPGSHRVIYGRIVDPGDEEPLDDGLLTYFQAPRSYTGQEVVELSCHGSDRVLGRLTAILIEQGARLARPGEFTERAYLNGRLDLAQAEAVMDLIRARTDAAARLASRQLGGGLSAPIRGLRGRLIELLAELEAAIDFPDDVEPPSPEEIDERLSGIHAAIANLLRTADSGRLYREGASVVIVGRPNVGKSSLLNALLGEQRAIVTEQPGTTRDVIEESLSLDGLPVRAMDTAGLRATEDQIESIGVELTREKIASADLVLWVLEAPAGLTAEDRVIAEELEGKPLVLAANKSDLGGQITCKEAKKALGQSVPVLPVSALEGTGMAELRTALRDAVTDRDALAAPVVVSNLRHQERLTRAGEALDAARQAPEGDLAALSSDLMFAADALGEITGETVTEETISQIFARFCVGK